MALVKTSNLKERLAKLQDKVRKESENASSNFDERFVTFEQGKTYRFRLLLTEGENRTSPFIEKYVHSVKDDNGYDSAVCAHTKYSKSWYKHCSVCTHLSKLYKSAQTGNKLDKATYDKFKAKFHGYMPVLVTLDPTTPENVGKVKIMHYNIIMKKFFDREIFGIVPQNSDDDDSVVMDGDIVGDDAFNLENGFDLIVTTAKNATNEQWTEYALSFARKATAIDIPEDDIEEMYNAINFDNLTLEFDPEDCKRFLNVKILEQSNDDTGDIDVPDTDVPAIQIETKPPKTPPKKLGASKEKAKPAKEKVVEDDIDIEDLDIDTAVLDDDDDDDDLSLDELDDLIDGIG
jgi:hypothetical protein